jgi:RNA polymerase sigma factor (sigma-70 family)
VCSKGANFLDADPDIQNVGIAASDLELVGRSIETPTAFAELYDRHGGRVVRYVARRVGVVDAEDIAAEVFVRAYIRRASCRGEHGSALPWLLGVANHVIADHRRIESRRLQMLERLAVTTPASVEHEHAGLAPELIRALRRVPAADRDALLLVVWGELSYEETATALDVPIGTVRSRIARARKRLIGVLGGDMAPTVPGLAGEEAANA